MDVSEAYALLGINDRANQIDLETLRAQVEVFGSDTPENKDKYEQAYAMICKDQQENYNQFQSTFVTPRKTHPLATWPVGCRNNGNTCYLNSVLQFLFTIKPLRDMILNCEKYLEDASPESLKSKRVGRSEVVLEKVERAQQCE
jgi:ubiquitin carboxyl-terminal hydrolase 25/28